MISRQITPSSTVTALGTGIVGVCLSLGGGCSKILQSSGGGMEQPRVVAGQSWSIAPSRPPAVTAMPPVPLLVPLLIGLDNKNTTAQHFTVMSALNCLCFCCQMKPTASRRGSKDRPVPPPDAFDFHAEKREMPHMPTPQHDFEINFAKAESRKPTMGFASQKNTEHLESRRVGGGETYDISFKPQKQPKSKPNIETFELTFRPKSPSVKKSPGTDRPLPSLDAFEFHAEKRAKPAMPSVLGQFAGTTSSIRGPQPFPTTRPRKEPQRGSVKERTARLPPPPSSKALKGAGLTAEEEDRQLSQYFDSGRSGSKPVEIPTVDEAPPGKEEEEGRGMSAVFESIISSPPGGRPLPLAAAEEVPAFEVVSTPLVEELQGEINANKDAMDALTAEVGVVCSLVCGGSGSWGGGCLSIRWRCFARPNRLPTTRRQRPLIWREGGSMRWRKHSGGDAKRTRHPLAQPFSLFYPLAQPFFSQVERGGDSAGVNGLYLDVAFSRPEAA